MLGDIEKSQLPHLSVELHDAKMGHPLLSRYGAPSTSFELWDSSPNDFGEGMIYAALVSRSLP
jgi:hypothetical protein